VCDPLNHTRFPKEDHVPDWAWRDKQGKKGDCVDYVQIGTWVYNVVRLQIRLSCSPTCQNLLNMLTNSRKWNVPEHYTMHTLPNFFFLLSNLDHLTQRPTHPPP